MGQTRGVREETVELQTLELTAPTANRSGANIVLSVFQVQIGTQSRIIVGILESTRPVQLDEKSFLKEEIHHRIIVSVEKSLSNRSGLV